MPDVSSLDTISGSRPTRPPNNSKLKSVRSIAAYFQTVDRADGLQFKIEVRPLDRQFESKLRAEKTNGEQPETVSTFPQSTVPQMLDDGDAFSLDLLVNQNTGVKIVDVVKVTFNRANLW